MLETKRVVFQYSCDFTPFVDSAIIGKASHGLVQPITHIMMHWILMLYGKQCAHNKMQQLFNELHGAVLLKKLLSQWKNSHSFIEPKA